jgi:hypothetical protein
MATPNQIKELRLQHKISRRVKKHDNNVSAQRTTGTRQHVQELLNSHGRSYGSRWIVTHLRRKHGYQARLADVQQALRELDPEGVASRTPGLRRPRQENYITAGPDEIWSCDGHDKIARFGFQIYAGIDAYSRKIVWFYCGNANRSSFSILRQYLTAVRAHNACPCFLRTDKGVETVLMAAAHYAFYLEAAAAEGIPPEEVKFEDCYIFGSSPQNVRIERLWLQVRQEVTSRWGDLFTLMEKTGIYQDWLIADRIILLFTFMPLIRKELAEFVLDKNEYPIRPQKNRAYHVAGVPNNLYNQEHDQHGVEVIPEVLIEWEAYVDSFGALLTRSPLLIWLTNTF